MDTKLLMVVLVRKVVASQAMASKSATKVFSLVMVEDRKGSITQEISTRNLVLEVMEVFSNRCNTSPTSSRKDSSMVVFQILVFNMARVIILAILVMAV